ncbi:hypothetical protein PQX77_019171 [Marasmius sp. AFHP31]|nr:hypothetical protein PQX77_019171 [Marasmius sp. AFHP31]
MHPFHSPPTSPNCNQPPSPQCLPEVFMIGIFCTISISCVASRAAWAFAHDKAIPFHEFFARVSPSSVPPNAYLLSILIQLFLGLIYLGSSSVFNVFVGVAVMCLGTSNGMAIALSLANKQKDVMVIPYSLGKLEPLMNVLAVLWIAFEIVLFSISAVVPVMAVTMSRVVNF